MLEGPAQPTTIKLVYRNKTVGWEVTTQLLMVPITEITFSFSVLYL